MTPVSWQYAVIFGAIVLIVLVCVAALGWSDGKKERTSTKEDHK